MGQNVGKAFCDTPAIAQIPFERVSTLSRVYTLMCFDAWGIAGKYSGETISTRRLKEKERGQFLLPM